MEHKSRRPDILVDDELIFAFYDARVPEGITNGADFDKWRREAERADPKLLQLRREDLMRHEARGITTRQFSARYPGWPQQLCAGVPLRAALAEGWRHADRAGGAAEPGAGRPLRVAGAGLLKEKVQAYAKGMPQRLRHKLGPAGGVFAGFRCRGAARRHAARPWRSRATSARN